MKEIEMYCIRCKKKTIQEKLGTEERDKGTYSVVLVYGKCSSCGIVNHNISNKKNDY